jgi:excisionase family DNA binding protein
MRRIEGASDMVVAMNNERLLVTVAEAAKMLTLSRRTLWRLTKDGKLPAVRYGRAVRYWIGSQGVG